VDNGRADDGEVWGLISDVHGNLPALERAIALLSTAGARRLAFLGDYLGRGESDACIARIKHVADIAIVGNRDLDWQDRVSAASKAYVLGLPRTAQAGKLLVSHGDARLTPSLSTAQIPRGFPKVWPQLEERHAKVWAFGHSHHARIWRKRGDGDVTLEATVTCATIDVEAGATYAVNVGTTGLPFPGKGGPNVALVDFARAVIRQIPLAQV
jgi:predicted phosphodiesterase